MAKYLLSASQVNLAKPDKKTLQLHDGEGLYLKITTNGNKSWFLRYIRPSDKKRTTIGLGKYPQVSLASAREEAARYREVIAKGTDPDKASFHHTQGKTFEQLFWIWLDRKSVKPQTLKYIRGKMERHALPAIGHMKLTDITLRYAHERLLHIEKAGKLETLKRICGIINEIMNYAVDTGILEHNCLVRLPNAFKSPVVRHNPSIEPSKLGVLLSDYRSCSISDRARLLFEFQLHTMVRPSEASNVVWDEIDLRNNIWTIPDKRMKQGKEVRVPLTDQVISILDKAKDLSSGSRYVFRSRNGGNKPMNSQTVHMALKRMGYEGKQTAHGFRSLASTWLNGQGFPSDWIEAALAHNDQNKIRAIYNRNDYLDQRREMMQAWSDYIESKLPVNDCESK